MKKLITVIFITIFLGINLVYADDSQFYSTCGGDNQVTINCIGDNQNYYAGYIYTQQIGGSGGGIYVVPNNSNFTNNKSILIQQTVLFGNFSIPIPKLTTEQYSIYFIILLILVISCFFIFLLIKRRKKKKDDANKNIYK